MGTTDRVAEAMQFNHQSGKSINDGELFVGRKTFHEIYMSTQDNVKFVIVIVMQAQLHVRERG